MSTEAGIGGMITLVTNSQIRYEGTLGHVDATNNTVSLTNVRVFGTEGRAKDGQVEVPPSDQMFEQIIFRGSDITDLTVFEQPRSQVVDPAILSAQPARHNNLPPHNNNNNNNNTNNNNNNNNNNNGPRGAQRMPPPRPGQSAPQYNAASHAMSHNNNNNNNNMHMGPPPRAKRFDRNDNDNNHNNNNFFSGGGGGNNNNNNNNNYRRSGHGGRGGFRSSRRSEHTGQDFRPATGAAKEEFKDDFDFSKSREEFEKKKSEFEKAKEDAKSHSKAYDRSSFFDKISCDAQDRNRLDREGMKKADAETFGSEMVGSMRGPRRGRGGRGRYMGRY